MKEHFHRFFYFGVLSMIVFISRGFNFPSPQFQVNTVTFRKLPFQRLFRCCIADVKRTSLNMINCGEIDLKVVTFNVLSPCYKRDKEKNFESSCADEFISRNELICNKLLESDADVIFLQEFWSSNQQYRDIFLKNLCSIHNNQNKTTYTIKELGRTSHWQSRGDGLAILIKNQRIVVQDAQPILFHDCGDRVALLMLLGVLPESTIDSIQPAAPLQQFIVVNTHLLFPHNEYSTKIRLREVTKILGFIEAYKQRDLCTTICGRSDVRLPIIIAGDFNGSPQGAVYSFLKSQNYHAVAEESLLRPESVSLQPSWISHRSHRNQNVAVDHIFYLNPSEQVEEKLPPIPDWTNLVFREVWQRILKVYGEGASMRDVFKGFDQDVSNFISVEEFETALISLGFDGEGSAALTKEELKVLVASADRNGDGMIDYKEFIDRFWLAELTGDPDLIVLKNASGPTGEASEGTGDTTGEVPEGNGTDSRPLSREFSDNETKSSQQKGNGLLLNSKRFSFARSTWLKNKSVEGLVDSGRGHGSETNLHMEVGQDLSNYFILNDTALPLMDPNAVPLGEMNVQTVHIWPSELERGVWPDNYTLSDHGMVECVLRCKVTSHPQL